jgi:hypothetical protein
MTESTADKVINAWRLRVPREPKQRGAYYRGISPLRSDADNVSGFVLKIEGPEHGAWKDYPTGRTGSLYTLARELGIGLPTTAPAPDSKRGYDDLADYAQAHGVAASVFEAAGWQDTTHHNRKAIVFPTSGGHRWRFIDGGSPPYINAPGYKACWYGLRKAIEKAQRGNLPLVLCNGEASTVVAQHHGIPACATTSGEKRLPDELLSELMAAWPGDVLLAYDCDDTGRRVAGEVAAQIKGAKVIDLALDNHGDLADFCRLWGADACRELMRRARRATAPSVMLTDRVDVYLDLLEGREVLEGKPLTFPLHTFHRLGGFAHIVSPGKIVGIVAPSGHGKTSMLETISDRLNRAGEGGLYYGPEWSDDEMLARRIQRYGGPSLDKLELHRLYMRDLVGNVPDDSITGQPLEPDTMSRARRIAEDVRSWRGQIEYYHQQRHLETLLETMGRGIEKRRDGGESVTFAVFDYAQILEVADAKSNDNFVEYAVGLIKQFVIEHNIVGFVGSQVTKSATAEAASGNVIGAHQANYLREDKFNLFISLTLMTELDARGDLVLTNRAIANVAKNSTGQRGQVKLLARFNNLTWEEKSW